MMELLDSTYAKNSKELWPSLAFADWADTCQTLHMWTQIVGKIRLASTPFANHWWHVPLYLNARGLGTSLMFSQQRGFEINFDFIDHCLLILSDDGHRFQIPLEGQSVASFTQQIKLSLDQLQLPVHIWLVPVEVEDKTPFTQDTMHHTYDREAVRRFWQVLKQSHLVLSKFRSEFVGKVSPVHFFWGSFDLAVTRFSGRPAPEHPGAPHVSRLVTSEAYSHEVSSAGFWPGNASFPEPCFYSYMYPEAEAYKEAKVEPDYATYSEQLREFILPFQALRMEAQPDEVLMKFLRSTYRAAADCGGWDRKALEYPGDLETKFRSASHASHSW